MASEIGIDFAAGCVGGAAGVLAGHPLDTVKVRLQTQCASNPTYRGTVHCFTTIAKAEKVQGLYKGVSSPLSSVAFLNAIIFGVHGSVAKRFTEKHALWTHFVAGCAAGSAQAFLASPCELVKLRVQLQPVIQNTPHKTPYQCLRNIIQQHGWKPLTRGLLATQLRDSTGVGVYFAAYEFLARKMSPDGQMESLNSLQLLLAGGLAGTFSWLFNYPVDVVKTRFQADDSYKNYMEVINKMYAERGMRTFFVGLGSTLIRAFPTNAATFFTPVPLSLIRSFIIVESMHSSDHKLRSLLDVYRGGTWTWRELMREQCPKTCGLCSTFPATNRQTRTPTRRTTQIPARSTPEYKLWYFALRGRGEPIRLLFHYLNEPFEDFRIQPTDWASTYKKTTPYGTIPILEVLETGEQLAQQFVILRYLARELDFTPDSDWEEAKVDEIADFHKDVGGQLAPLTLPLAQASTPPTAEQTAKVENITRDFFPFYQRVLTESGSGFFIPSGVSWADFVIADFYETFRSVHPQIWARYPYMEAHRALVYGLTELQDYLKSRPNTPI
ncbi:mitochondrial carrier protein domain-containing protein [Ditylenchus destructor]|uniref:Mitochondrial basic amino acids transporter n=1 Tax=Ditylenchus destructor TaxID=166010 RepID=A0AAD4MTD3_9BILA|nr:mitochondrial carrier protein domain-containing protein [Ditylenchus destructor]